MTYNYHSDNLYPAIIVLAVWFAFYMAPGLVAWARGHRDTFAIFVLNFFLGWTFFGWVVALVWAFTSNVRTRFERQNFTLCQVVGETDEAYAERLRRLREINVLPAQP